LAAFARLAEELRSRDPAPPHRKGSRWGSRASGAAYYAEIELWKARPDFAAFRVLVTELKERQVTDTFVDRLRARLALVATLPIAERRQLVGVAQTYLDLALGGGRLPAPIAERLEVFIAEGGTSKGLREFP
jgi:hypothetical protein